MRIATTLLLTIALVLGAACGDDGDSSNAGPTATSTAAAPSTPMAVPERPNAIEDYAPTAASYLSGNQDAFNDCLAELRAAWDMPGIDPASACVLGNTDEDTDDELIATFSAQPGDPSPFEYIEYVVAVLDRRDGFNLIEVAFQSPTALHRQDEPINPILRADDMNGDGGGELAYATRQYGAHTVTDTLFIMKGTSSGYTSLTGEDGITQTDTAITLEDTDGDGTIELLLTGGTIGSVGAGPQRPRTEIYAWDGDAYTLRETRFEPPTYLYHAILDADALFAAAKYAEAESAYVAAAGDSTLDTWMEAEKHERAELKAYAYFRAGLASLMADEGYERASEHFTASKAQLGTLHAQLADAFVAGYEAKAEIAVGCAAVRDDLRLNLPEYEAFWYFGYGNPAWDEATVCPF